MLVRFILFLNIMMISGAAFAKGVKLFESSELITAELSFDITKFRKEKENLTEKGLPGVLTLPSGKPLRVEVLSRGYGSMSNENPPFKLKFNRKEVKKTVFRGVKKIKALVPSQTGVGGREEVLSNYLTYRLLEIYTKYAFKTRLFKIKFIDSSETLDTFETLVFFLEPNKTFAKRYDLEYIKFDENHVFDIKKVSEKIDMSVAKEIMSFNFLGGSVDSAIVGLKSDMSDLFDHPEGIANVDKNTKMFRNKKGVFIPVAYDFDISGFIDRNFCFWKVGYGILKHDSLADNLVIKPGEYCNIEEVQRAVSRDYSETIHKPYVLNHREQFKKLI